MDRCPYCKGYHHPHEVCDEYIEAVKKGKVKSG